MDQTAPTGASKPQRTAYRVLGYMAIAHSVLLLVSLFFMFARSFQYASWLPYAETLWVGMATLWFFWPIILALHPGRSAKRAYLSLGIAAVIFALPCYAYLRLEGPRVLLPEEMITFSPYDLVPYGIAYGSGLVDGERDARRGRFILEAYGFGTFAPSAPSSLCNFPAQELKQCGIEFNHVTGWVVNTTMQAHARSYNRVMMSKIRQRCPALVQAAEQEDARWEQSWKDGDHAGREEAARDIANGQLFVELDDVGKEDPAFEKMLQERYRIGLKRVDPQSDPKWANKVYGHHYGYNAVAEKEIKRRFGKDAIKSIWDSRYSLSK